MNGTRIGDGNLKFATLNLDRLSSTDKGPYSVFTRTLLPLIGRTDLSIQELSNELKDQVYNLAKSAGREQRPTYYDGIIGRFCLPGCESTGGRTAGVKAVGEGVSIASVTGKSAASADTSDGPKSRIGKEGAPMVLIPAGEFWMGSSDGEGSKDEHPRHYVRLDTFYMDKFEVTNRLFHQFIKNTGHKTKSWGDAYVEANWWAFPKEGRWESSEYASWQTPEGGVSVFDSNRAEHPVVSVTWDNAEAYCRWAGKRLPTEAEWEYAARAGTTTKYWWGANNPGSRKVENVADKSAQGFIRYSTESYDDGFVRTAPVGSYEANPWGLHDINGNVSEWVDDWYVEDYYSRSPEHNPKPIGLSIDREVVYRGGSWMNALNISLASRFHSFLSSPEMFRRPDVGFRCAQDVPK